ncbi:MAG: nitroreductase [Planctomycetota bacterium]
MNKKMMPDFNQFFELARERRTSRGYLNKPVSREAIVNILEAARWAPSAANTQPWEFIVVSSPEIKAKIQQAFLQEALEHDDLRYRKVSEQQAALLLEPALIGVCGQPTSRERFVNTKELADRSQDELYLLGMGAMIQNMLLAATALGLDSTWIARLARIPEVSEILQIPEHLELVAFVVVGYTSQKLTASEGRRVAIMEKSYLDCYGQPYY